jgi:hypothetical protein
MTGEQLYRTEYVLYPDMFQTLEGAGLYIALQSHRLQACMPVLHTGCA